MRQVIQHVRSGKTAVVDSPVPSPGPGMVLVRTAASVISSGTERSLVEFTEKSLLGKAVARPDLVSRTLDKARREGVLSAAEAVRRRLEEAMPLGYASAGTVAEIGQGVDEFRPGDRVACGGGGYAVHAEYAVVPRNLVARLPQNVSFEEGAFATLGAVALHAFRLGELRVGEDVAVLGLGLVGQLATGIALAAGCRVFGVDLKADRVEIARAAGARAALREEAEGTGKSATGGRGFDCVLICADGPSNDPIELAAALACDRGRIVAVGAVGLDVPRRSFYEKELQLIVSRSYGPGRYDPAYEEGGHDYPAAFVRWTEGRNLEAFLGLLGQGKLDVRRLISHRWPVDQAEAAYAAVGEGALGVVLTYPVTGHLAIAPGARRLDVPRAGGATSGLGLGVLGAGNYARQVALPIVRRIGGMRRVGVASSRGLGAADAARRFGFRYATSDEETILADSDVDAVAILTRHNLHAAQTARALRAGKHVLCEKPLSLDREGVDEVAQAVADSGRLLTVGFNRRFSPAGQRLEEFVRRGTGPWTANYRVNAGPLPPGHWLLDPAQGGGRLLGEACHFLDFLTFLFGLAPVRVRASGGGEDFVVVLEFEDGSTGSVTYVSSGDPSLAKERLEVFGSGRAAVLDDFRRLTLAEGGRRRVWRDRLRQDKGHRGLWRAFTAAVTLGGPPPIPYRQVFGAALATIAAEESLRSGRPLDVPSLAVN